MAKRCGASSRVSPSNRNAIRAEVTNALTLVMEYADIMQLVGIYLGGFTGAFVLVFGAWSLWKFFKSMTATDFRGE